MKKKEYVSLSLQIVDVKLSDCIAGSVIIERGESATVEINESSMGSGNSFDFGTW